MHEFFQLLVHNLINFINEIGYFGIFIGMFIESTMIPVPSELIMIPAGISASNGTMNIYMIIFVGILGNVAGAIFSYYLAYFLGRKIIFKMGKYFFVKEATIIKIEDFFKQHGSISVFIGRLLMGFRHFISLPAGLAKMNFTKFCIYTILGSTIWTIILVMLGFAIGDNQELIGKYLHIIMLLFAIAVVLLIFFYKIRKK